MAGILYRMLRGVFPKKELIIALSRTYDSRNSHLVSQLVAQALDLNIADFISYDAPYEDPEYMWPIWYRGKHSYSGNAHEQTAEQVKWIGENAARLIGTELWTYPSAGVVLYLSVDDLDSVYLSITAQDIEIVRSLPAFISLSEFGAWEVTEEWCRRWFV